MIAKEDFLLEFYSRTALFAKNVLGDAVETDKYLERLRNTKIAITGSREILNSFNGQHMMIMSVNLLSRFCMNIDIIMPSDIKTMIENPLATNRSLSFELAKLGKGINPFNEIRVMEFTTKHYDGVISIGDCSNDIGRTVIINSDGWVSYVNTENNPMPWTSENYNPIGAYVASCIGVAELFKILFARLKQKLPYRYVGSLVFSAFDYGFMHSPLINPCLPKIVSLETIHFVSMGAINSGVLYALCAVPGIRGNVVIIEPQKLDISNLNRYAFSLAKDAVEQASKIEAAVRFIGSRLTVSRTFNESYKTVAKDIGPIDFAVVGVDNVEGRWDVQSNHPKNIICGGTVKDSIRISTHAPAGQGACLKCIDPELLPQGEEPIPTISFVSILAGILMAGEIIKCHIKNYSPYYLNNVLDLSLLDSSLFKFRAMSKSKDCPSHLSLSIQE